MVVGYARVSTGSQSYEDQVAAAGEGRRRLGATPWLSIWHDAGGALQAHTSVRDFDCVSRDVPDNWTFEIGNMPIEGRG